jgi:hypothetical protein
MNEGAIWAGIDSSEDSKEGHEAITTALRDFEKMGYFVNQIHYQNGTLNITCRCLRKEGNGKAISIDGVSGAFKS